MKLDGSPFIGQREEAECRERGNRLDGKFAEVSRELRGDADCSRLDG